MTEAKALRNLRNGSEEALEWFIHQYNAYVTTVVYNIIGTSMDMSDVEEVVSDVFVTLWQNADSVRSVKGYLGTVARNKAKNKAREAGCDLSLDENILVIEGPGPESTYEKKELSAAVKRAVFQMPPPDKEIFLRFYYYYQSLEDISTEMGINISTVKTRLRRGRQKLKVTLTRYLT